jgi:hypothetical protein
MMLKAASIAAMKHIDVLRTRCNTQCNFIREMLSEMRFGDFKHESCWFALDGRQKVVDDFSTLQSFFS